MILVVGATGLLGSETCRLLAAAAQPFKALVRTTSDKSKVAHLESLGAEIVRGDLKDRSSVEAACKGVNAVISTASTTISRQEGDSIQTVDLEGQLNLIDAAKAAGVSQFIKISWISYKDVAKFAVASLDNAAARNAVIELGGPESLSPLEVVRIFEEVQGRAFEVQHVPDEALLEQKKAAEDPLQESFAGLMLFYSAGSVIDMRETLEKFPVELSSVRDYAQASQQAATSTGQ